MPDEIKKRGRPPLSPEAREARRIAKNKSSAEWHKKNGYAAQKRYKAAHPEQRGQNYEPKIRIALEFKPIIESLTAETGLSITQLFISAIEEKYKVVLHRDIENKP